MNTDTTKDFGPIRDDYAFFQGHSTEADADRRAYLDELRPRLSRSGGPLTLLDFGCGDGGFTADFLRAAGVERSSLRLLLVEPNDPWRESAAARLRSFTSNEIVGWPALPERLEARCDVILANHVFYYVPRLVEALRGLLAALADGGILVTAMAGRRNALIQFWLRAFEMLGRPLPYHTSEDLAAAFSALGSRYRARDVWYDLSFDDGEENRAAILRFLLSDHFAELPRDALLDLFTPYVNGQRIAICIVHEHFVVVR